MTDQSSPSDYAPTPIDTSTDDGHSEGRLSFLFAELERLRESTDEGTATRMGITDARYHRALDNAEKVLLDYEDEIVAGPPWPPIVLLALDLLGMDTDDDGWAPHRERAERMGW